VNRAERRRAMREMGFRRSKSKRGRRADIRVTPEPKATPRPTPQRGPGIAKTKDGLYVAQGVTVEDLERAE
jgi:hypothetical protein